MEIKYDIAKLKNTIDDLCTLTGLSMGIFDTEFKYLYINNGNNGVYCSALQMTAGGTKNCNDCDMNMLARAAAEKRPYAHICHAGLCDTGVPILKSGLVVGYIMIGRVRMSTVLDWATEKKLREYGLDTEQMREYYQTMTYLTKEQYDALLHLVSRLVFENAIEIDYDDFIIRATKYINDNLRADLSVKALCSALFVSKNFLYNSFRSFYAQTVNEYVTERRIALAKDLLSNTERSAYEIAEEVGISNYTYFSKIFKKTVGMSPAKYRKIK